jgi:hypothetical protein
MAEARSDLTPHSHTTLTFHPSLRNAVRAFLSLALFASIFFRHQSARVFGHLKFLHS